MNQTLRLRPWRILTASVSPVLLKKRLLPPCAFAVRLAGLLALTITVAGTAQTLDTVVFGDSDSESAHGLNAPMSAVETGALGQTARRMAALPSDIPVNGEGGYLEFTAKCDPVSDNFLTVKLWGSDYNATASGMLMAYLIEGGQQYQVGYKDQQVGEYSPLAWGYVGTPPAPGHFHYATIPLPLSMTQGRTSVQVRIIGINMNTLGSLPVYRAYVHLGSYFEPAAGDPQAPAPAPAPIRPAQPVGLQQALDEAKRVSNLNVTNWIANGGGDPDQLILAYNTPWSTGYQNLTVLTRAADIWTPSIDSACQGYFQNPSNAGSAWGGAYGTQGDQIRKVTAAGFGSRLDQVIDLGDPAGPATRRVLWAKMLKASRDAGRFGRLGPTSAQSLLGDNELYKANKGLQILGSADAFSEPDAMRYLLESAGLTPWLGSDNPDGTHGSFMGTNYYELTPNGMTKEDGYVSAYGEVYDVIVNYYTMSGDTRMRDQVNKVFKTRSYFKYPMVDSQGYRCFQLVGPLDWRHQQEMPMNQNYGETGTRLSVAPATLDPYAMAVTKQQIADNQGGVWGTDMGSALTLEKIINAPDTGARLPMTEGQPDFAWVDVDNGVAVIKRGEECTWIEPYWQSRNGIHSTGRVLQLTPTTSRLGYVRIDTQVNWNKLWRVTPDGLSWDNAPQTRLYGLVHQAYANEKFIDGTAPADAVSTREEFIGRAQFYSCRYGRYLVGINMDKTQSFVLKTPTGFTSAQDLITKTTKSGTITVPPVSAVVLDLGSTTDTTPLPRSARYISANGVQGGVSVAWDTVGGATSYTVKRATTSGGPYTTIATGIGGIYPKAWGSWAYGTYLDSTAVNGTTYYYIVAGVNANGEGYPSPESAGATPLTTASVNSLPFPWANTNWSAGGSASYASGTGTFSLIGGGGDIWYATDGGHFVYQPISGDGALVARLTNSGGAYKCGLMIRQNIGASAMNVSLIYQNGGVGVLRRDGQGSGEDYAPGGGSGLTLPVWLKLEHKGKATICSYAPDVSGAPGTWTTFSTWSNEISGTAFIGLFSTSGNPTTFDHVTGPLYGNVVPPAPLGLTAAAGNARVNLAWSAADQAATYTVRRATTNGGPYNTVVASGLATLTYTDTTVSNATAYYYVVTATNAAGTSGNSSQASATPVATAPTPTNLTVAATGTQAVLNWTASSGATGYTILRSVDGVSWTTVVSGVTATTYTNTGLTSGQSYYYSVQATNGNGASAPATSVVATTQPTVPILRSADSNGTQGKLLWNNAGGATAYNVWRATTVNGTYTKIASNVAAASYMDSGLTPGSDYFYKISGVNASGESAQGTALKLGWGTGLLGNYYNSTNFSGAPGLVRIDPSIQFNWGQNAPAPGMNYDFSVRWTGQLEAPTTENYTFTGAADDSIQAYINGVQVVNNGTIALVAGQKYTLIVEFRDNEGAAYFNLTWATPTMTDQPLPTSRLYPAVPGKICSTGGTATASADNSAYGEGAPQAFDGNSGSKWNTGANGATAWLQYQFAGGATWAVNQYQLTSAGDVPERDPKDWTLQGSNNGTTWTILDTQTGQTFASRGATNIYSIANTTAFAYYRLNITANNGGSGYSIQLAECALLSPAPLPPPPATVTPTPADSQATLTWSPVSGAVSYSVFRSIYDGGPYTPVASVTTGASYVDTKLVNGTRYYYVVATASANGQGLNSAQVSVLVAPIPAAPTGLTATVGNAQATVQWSAAPWATSYTLLRSTTSGSGYATVATGLTGTSYTNTGLTNGTTYYYVVSAANATGTSGNSTQVSAIPAIAGTASSNDNTNAGSESPAQAFDGSTTTKWCIAGSAAWLQYQFTGGPQIVTGYVITSANDVPGRDPKDWTFQGSNDGTTWTTLDTETGQAFASRFQSKVYAAANATAYTRYRLNVTANAGGTGYGLQFSELTFQYSLPSPWSTADIGAVSSLGGAASLNGTYVLRCSGNDIWNTADAFRYVYQTASGDCSIIARVAGLTSGDSWAKAGVMIRESAGANSAHATVVVTPGNGVAFQYRSSTGGSSSNTNTGGLVAPYWVKIVRSGNVFTASRSTDGNTWISMGSVTISMSSNVLIGLPISSHGVFATAPFDNLTVVP